MSGPELLALADRLNLGAPESAQAEAARVGASAGEVGTVAVSACLLGAPTRFDGRAKTSPPVLSALAGRALLPICPELLAGLGCPRAAIAFAEGDGDTVVEGRGRALDDTGADRAAALVRGAERALDLIRRAGAHEAVLKERSPSCGLHAVHGAQGVKPGRGVFAALAVRAGIACRSEEDL